MLLGWDWQRYWVMRLTSLFSVSMDGGNINLKFYEALKQKRNENFFHSLSDIGTCSLRSIHGAIRPGVKNNILGYKENL